MLKPLSISKSVTRGFRVLELFSEQRRPMTAADIGRRLDMPQPSARALLKNLVDIGYLHYRDNDRTYLPTPRVAALGDWLPEAASLAASLARAVDRIAARAGETTSLSTVRDGKVEVLHVRKARHPVALQLEPGVGVALWRTAVGRTLLAQYDEPGLGMMLERQLRGERSAAGRRAIQALPRVLRKIRSDGYFAGYDIFLEGVGALCVPVPSTGPAPPPERGPGAEPLVIAVAGLRERIRPREARLLRLIRASLKRSP